MSADVFLDAGGIASCGPDREKKEQENADGRTEWCEGRDLYGRWAKDGPYLVFDDRGGLRLAGEFRDGRRHGVWQSFDADGHLIGREEYDNGVRAGAAPRAADPRPGPPPADSPDRGFEESPASPPPAAPSARENAKERSGEEVPPPSDELDASDPFRSAHTWSAGRVGVQFGLGALGAALAVAAGGGAGVLAGNAACNGGSVRDFSSQIDSCHSSFIWGGAILLYIPLNALGVWLGGKIMGGRGTYGWTVVGSAINLGLAFLPSVGIIAAAFSAGPIITYHESELAPGQSFVRGAMPAPAPAAPLTQAGARELRFPIAGWSF